MSLSRSPVTPKDASLPSTLSGLVEAAIVDSRMLDHAIYYPLHANWHHVGNHRFCQVCLAGSLIAGRLNFPSDSTFSSCDFSSATKSKLETLNSIRLGAYQRAFFTFYGISPSQPVIDICLSMPMPICRYFDGWPEFYAHLGSLENLLPSLREIDRLSRSS